MGPGSITVYTGLLAAIAGLISLVISPSAGGALLAVGGSILTMAGFLWPAATSETAIRSQRLDEYMPVWQFGECHETYVAASPERVSAAIRAVTADEIALFNLLTWIRRGGRPGPENILNAPGRKPLIDVAIATSFIRLADEPPRELVVGTLIVAPPELRPRGRLTPDAFRIDTPAGVVLAAMNFRIDASAGGSRLTTETRVRAGDTRAARRFAVYWRVIHPGSALIRRMWLRAIKTRAERR